MKIKRMRKKCCTCKIVKPKNNFVKDKTRKDGLCSQCKSCQKKYREKPQVRKKALKRMKQWSLNNLEHKKELDKKWYENNKEHKSKYDKQRYLENRDEIIKNQYKYLKEKRNSDVIFRLTDSLRSRLLLALRGINKSASSKELFGLIGKNLMDYLELMFYGNMTRENYGKVWHIDHIKPCSSFDLSKPEEQRKCFHYTNLQPLLAKDNLRKSNKIFGNIGEF
jgi:hypothetical protein